MTITFTSDINQNGNKDKIKFTSEVIVSDYQDFRVFEFSEPSQGIQNRIEVSSSKVNIFAGPSTINLDLYNKTTIEYITPQGPLYMEGELIDLISKDNEYFFHYKLVNGVDAIGEYKIKLEIKE